MTTIVRNHGMGIFSYKLHDQSGFGHGGIIDEFNAQSTWFGDIDVAISITSNGSELPINEVFSKILELYLGEPKIKIAEQELENYVGVYINEKDPSSLSVFEKSGDTLIHVIMDEFMTPLVYKGNRRFLFNQMYGPQISFTFSEDGKEMLFEQAKYKGIYRKE